MNHQANNRRSGIGGVMKIGALASIAAAAVAASLPLRAHHSFSAEFDGSKEIKATGAVSKLDWQNPHGWIHLTVTELCERTAAGRGPDAVEQEWACRTPDSKEEAADWAFEIGSPNGLMRQGWTRNSLKAGDVVTVQGSRARDGSTNSNARSVTTADGKRLFAGSSQDSTP